jgi:hypothetical protein
MVACLSKLLCFISFIPGFLHRFVQGMGLKVQSIQNSADVLHGFGIFDNKPPRKNFPTGIKELWKMLVYVCQGTLQIGTTHLSAGPRATTENLATS